MSFPGIPFGMQDPAEWMRRAAITVNNIMRGRTNNYYTVTLTANAASTVLQLPPDAISRHSVILFDPLTANAAADLYGGGMYVTSANRNVANGQVTITHPNNANADKEFRIAIIG